MAGEYGKVSVTLPSALLERVRRRIGGRGLSRHVTRALEEEERRAALRSWLDGEAARVGPIPQDVMDQVRREWLGDAHIPS